MTGISFIIVTGGSNFDSLEKIIDSIELQNIPNYEIIVIGGYSLPLVNDHLIHIPFDESVTTKAWLTRKKNTGVLASKFDVLVIMHDYMTFDSDWYTEFEKFGVDWDICVHQNLVIDINDHNKYVRGNGWRIGHIPQYPEFPYPMQIPYDIDHLVSYMGINGSYWCCKKHVILDEMLDESLLAGEDDDTEWWYRVVPQFMGLPNNSNNKIVANPNCKVRNIKLKPSYPGNPDWNEIENSFANIWDELRNGIRRSGVFYYEKSLDKIIKAP